MGVVSTKRWLQENGKDPVKMCENLVDYFDQQLSSVDIYHHLARFGMYRPSILNRNEGYDEFVLANHWGVIETLYQPLRKKMKGPDVPIFLFPLNEKNAKLMKETNGKAGVAFKDKLFLFLPSQIDEKEIKALLTHEYHHVCRLNHIKKKEEEMTLLDAMILEGLAEKAVTIYCGESYNANWTSYYTELEVKKHLKEFILPNKQVKKNHPLYGKLLYGMKGYPRMIGYCSGYYLIHQLIKYHSFSYLEKLESEQILKLSKLN